MSAANSRGPADVAGLLTPAERALLRLLHPDGTDLPPLADRAWETVLQLARREQVVPLVFAALDRHEDVPARVRQAFGADAAAARAAVEGAYDQLSAVLRALRGVGVEFLLLKGAALAAFAYPAAALRPFTDLDLLVRAPDVDAADRALHHAGYALAGHAPSDADRLWRHARGYYDPRGDRLPVDLHWRYAGYPHLLEVDAAEVFSRARPAALPGGERALLPAPADQVVELAVAFLRELWYGKPRLRYLRDLAQVVRVSAVHWATVDGVTARLPALRTPVYLALRLVAELFDGPIPPEALAWLRPRRGAAVADRLGRRLHRNLLRQESVWGSVAQVAVIRALDARGAGEYARWLASTLLFVPRPLRRSRRRWWRRALGG